MNSNEAVEVKSLIRSLLISNPRRSTIKQLWTDFNQIEGRPIPYKNMGFSSLEEYLISIPDTVSVYGTGPNAEVEGVVTSKSEHINTMVLKQKKPTPSKRSTRPYYSHSKFRPQPHRPQKGIPIPSLLDLRFPTRPEVNPHLFNTRNTPLKFPIRPNRNLELHDTRLNPESQVFEMNPQLQGTGVVPTLKPQLQDTRVDQNLNPQSQNAEEPDPHLQDTVQPNPQLQATGVVAELNPEDTELVPELNLHLQDATYSSSPDQRDCGYLDEGIKYSKYSNNFEYNNESHTILTSHMSPNSHKTLATNFNLVKVEKPDCDNLDDYGTGIPLKVLSNLRKLIQMFPDGIACTRLPVEYKKMFKKKISYELYSYKSLIEMCSNLPQIFHYVQASCSDYILYDKNQPIPPTVQTVEPKSERVQVENVAEKHILEELTEVDWSTSSTLIPPDVFRITDEINRFFPVDVKEGDILDINVGELYDLSHFWVYLIYGGLDLLMKQLHEFFSANHGRFHIPEILLEVGLYCASMYANRYHRCVIVNLLPKLKKIVRVFFIDYGTVDNVSVNSIWFLPKQFGELPSQAIRVRLSNIYPVYENRPWSAESVGRFEQLFTRRVVVGEVTKINEEDHIIELYLADITNQDDIFYINDLLVKEGYALYTDEERKKTLVDEDCRPNVTYIHLYPEFYEIESGMAPTSEEMRYIIENKISLHHYMPQYFHFYYSEDIDYIQKQHEKINRKKDLEETLPLVPLDSNFDLSFFPDTMADEITNLLKQEENSKSNQLKSETVIKEESNQAKNETVVKEKHDDTILCNRKKYLYRKYGSTSSSGRSESDESPEIVLNNSIQNLSLSSDCDSSFISNPFKPTNPFLDSYDPFRTNPFITSLEETVNRSELFEVFAKPSEEKRPQTIINNLNDTQECTCKKSKQTNVERSPPNNVVRSANSSIVSNESSANSFQTPIRRVRTPPGFENQQNVLPQNVPHYNFISNPYYQRFQLPQPNLPYQIPYTQPYLNNYYNYYPQMYPNQYNFNLSNWQQMYQPPRYGCVQPPPPPPKNNNK